MAHAKTFKRMVPAFPFATSIKIDGGEALAGQVMKLAQTGFIAELAAGAPVKVGQKVEFAFELPVLHIRVAGKGSFVKLYNQLAKGQLAKGAAPATGGAPAPSAAQAAGFGLRRLAEIRFDDVPEDAMQRVRQFLAAIGRSE